MLKMGPRSIITLVIVFTLCTCIDPYSPKLAGYTSLLVVDGLITDANTSYTVKLSRTFQEQTSGSIEVSNAVVSISDDAGAVGNLVYKGHGIYKTDSTEFQGSIGRTYVLHILTSEGEEYISEPSKMEPVAEIDSIYYSKDQQVINNGTQTQDGISIFLDSKEGGVSQNYRWAFSETWKFKVPSPKRYNYINEDVIVPVTIVKEYCWENRKSDEILIRQVYSGQAEWIEKEPILFIATDKSNRLLLQYSILVRQYSISKNEYDFWDNMKKVNENTGDIFATQPFSIKSNIHNINDSNEEVLGYFQVSAVKQKRKNISFNEIAGLNLPYYHYPCERIEMAPKDYPWSPLSLPLTWDDIYVMFASSYSFVEPKYIPGTFKLDKLVFASPECADCELTGTQIIPAFWEDLN